MRILFTGASSFTGAAFAHELSAAGHQVLATFRGTEEQYTSTRGARVAALKGRVEPIWNVEFGNSQFLEIVASQEFDILLHHAAEVGPGYRSWEFDPIGAAAANTRNARQVLTLLARRGCSRVVLTGTVFEPYEGVGDPEQRAFNPYGLSKHLSFEVFRMESERLGFSLGKFVIANPFGPLEEMRFTSYLAKEWSAGRVATINTPLYVRDNIHVSLLALAYRGFCTSLPECAGIIKLGPSGYVEGQGAFAHRVAREIGSRSGKDCKILEFAQKEFPEPIFRTNIDLVALRHPDWSESGAWDDLARYYNETFGL